jgi:hypothetical protein
MKRIVILLSISIVFLNNSIAQTLNQDAEGKSTIMYQGGNISLDVAKANITFAYSNLGLLSAKSDVSKKIKPVWGVNAYGKNNDGLSNIFNSGELQPEAGLGGFLGIKYRIDEKPQTLSALENQKNIFSSEKTTITNQIEALIEKTDEESIKKVEELKKRQKELDIEIQKIQDQREKLNEQRVRKLVLGYLRGGMNASSFNLVEENADTTSLSKSFNSNDFYGGFIGIGGNYETGRWLLGLSLDYEFTNNFESLTQATYTLTTSETQGNKTLESKKDITGYSGNYETYERINVNFDAIMFCKLDEAERNFVAWNFYIRHKISQNINVMPSYTNVGLGAYFFNKSNKFLGGIYVEAPDFFQDIERTKAEPDLEEIQNRLTFGLVARFNFASIAGPSF